MNCQLIAIDIFFETNYLSSDPRFGLRRDPRAVKSIFKLYKIDYYIELYNIISMKSMSMKYCNLTVWNFLVKVQRFAHP